MYVDHIKTINTILKSTIVSCILSAVGEIIVVYTEDIQHKKFLRLMLAEVLEKQSAPLTTEEQRAFMRQGAEALKRALETMETQIYS